MKPILECLGALSLSFGLGIGFYFLGSWLRERNPEQHERVARALRFGLVLGIGSNGINLVGNLVRHRYLGNDLMLLLIVLTVTGGRYLAGRTQRGKRC